MGGLIGSLSKCMRGSTLKHGEHLRGESGDFEFLPGTFP